MKNSFKIGLLFLVVAVSISACGDGDRAGSVSKIDTPKTAIDTTKKDASKTAIDTAKKDTAKKK